MLTSKFKLYNQTKEEIELLDEMQQQCSYALRVIYSNLDLTTDKEFIKETHGKNLAQDTHPQASRTARCRCGLE